MAGVVTQSRAGKGKKGTSNLFPLSEMSNTTLRPLRGLAGGTCRQVFTNLRESQTPFLRDQKAELFLEYKENLQKLHLNQEVQSQMAHGRGEGGRGGGGGNMETWTSRQQKAYWLITWPPAFSDLINSPVIGVASREGLKHWYTYPWISFVNPRRSKMSIKTPLE